MLCVSFHTIILERTHEYEWVVDARPRRWTSSVSVKSRMQLFVIFTLISVAAVSRFCLVLLCGFSRKVKAVAVLNVFGALSH